MGWYDTVRPSYPGPKSIYSALPEDMDDWTCSNWIEYHRNILKTNGRESARIYVERDAERVGGFAEVHSCKYDCTFVKYFKSQGIAVGNLFSNVYCGVSDVVTSTTTAATSVAQSGANVASGIEKVTSTISNGKILILGLVLGSIWYFNKNDNGKKNK